MIYYKVWWATYFTPTHDRQTRVFLLQLWNLWKIQERQKIPKHNWNAPHPSHNRPFKHEKMNSIDLNCFLYSYFAGLCKTRLFVFSRLLAVVVWRWPPRRTRGTPPRLLLQQCPGRNREYPDWPLCRYVTLPCYRGENQVYCNRKWDQLKLTGSIGQYINGSWTGWYLGELAYTETLLSYGIFFDDAQDRKHIELHLYFVLEKGTGTVFFVFKYLITCMRIMYSFKHVTLRSTYFIANVE